MKNSRKKALEKMAGSYFPKMGTKSQALEYYKAKKGKKKLPTFTHHVKDTPYKHLTIDEYEKIYK